MTMPITVTVIQAGFMLDQIGDDERRSPSPARKGRLQRYSEPPSAENSQRDAKPSRAPIKPATKLAASTSMLITAIIGIGAFIGDIGMRCRRLAARNRIVDNGLPISGCCETRDGTRNVRAADPTTVGRDDQ